jgi:iron(III) transport system permease protein
MARPVPAAVGSRWFLPAGQRPIAALAGVGLTALVAVPMLMLIFAAVRGPIGSLPFESQAFFTTSNFQDAATQGGLYRLGRDTFFYVAGVVTISVVLGFALAWIVERTDIPFPNAIFILVLVPFLIPQSTMTNAWLEHLLPRTGQVNIWLRETLNLDITRGPIDPYNIQMMIVFQGLLLTPIVFLVLAAILRNQNGAMEEASRASGAGHWGTLRRVTAPLLFPGVFTAVVLAVWLTLDSTLVPFLLGGAGKVSLFNFRIWAALNSADGSYTGFGLASAYAVMGMVTLFVLFAVYALTTRHTAKYATITGNSMRAPKLELGYWFLPTAGFVLAYLALTWGVPGYRLVQGSFRAGLSGYWAQLTSSRFLDALFNSAVMSIGSATLGTIVIVLVAWTVVRSRAGPWKNGLDLLATSSLVIPAALAGVAFLTLFLTIRGIPLYGSLIGVTYALAYRLAIPYRITNAAMRQVGKDMEEVSATSGASPFTTLRRVTIPMLAPAISISWTIFFVFAVRESTLIRYLGFNDPTFGTGLGRFRGGPPGAAEAGTVLSILFILGTILGVRYLLFRRARL